ncbi:GTP-binding protein [Candidatus Uzinura diaspidicola str. ASNER]|uniref:GTPase Obg n=1 Tax=Candidatus Uzinura diaspidicola str. ASNER TaxID=1133592 RepID=L7VMV4_9FLAO|nr:GTP-binding protein [Candidatus Uzinura diaspidicola str. ASNER]
MTFESFIDKVNIFCRSGDGGNGIVHFRREKFVYKGGPDGGDGGDGGSIFLRGDSNLGTLLHFRYNKNYKAKNGLTGKRSRKRGASGKKLILNVPIGTIARDQQGNILCEIMHNKQESLVLPGGKGGLGNWHFRNSVKRTPLYAQPGLQGVELWITLELKILADVGLIGLPNAGKSTLLSVLTSAKPKIGNYAFTTITPKLGYVKYKEEKSFIISDIPGILKGASKGKGIGLRFLRHIERNVVLLFLISAEEKNILYIYKILLQELSYYKYNLLEKDRLLAISKYDLIEENMKNNLPYNIEILCVSSHYLKGLNYLKKALCYKLKILKVCG